jgi:hypothetical protein
VRLRRPVVAVLAHDKRGQAHVFIVACELTKDDCAAMTRTENVQALVRLNKRQAVT